ncbi:hypothetical protein TNCV_4107051 [Trichonephila clavipes]|nr:hypothetical protein TNCV_4107051 [Trichonephila clavipes]
MLQICNSQSQDRKPVKVGRDHKVSWCPTRFSQTIRRAHCLGGFVIYVTHEFAIRVQESRLQSYRKWVTGNREPSYKTPYVISLTVPRRVDPYTALRLGPSVTTYGMVVVLNLCYELDFKINIT